MIAHHGVDIGRRHARKHLASALDVAAEKSGAPESVLKKHRVAVLTAETPAQTLAALAAAFDEMAQSFSGDVVDLEAAA